MDNNDVMDKIVYLRLDDIIPNRFQPREIFDDTGLEELAASIKEHGVIQPIVARPIGDKYELIAGERRCKASSLAGLTTIPAIVRQMDDNESAKVSLLENLQRKDLSPIEEARTFKRILELDNMTQDDLAKTMGKSQPLIANKIRLLTLPEEIQDSLIKNQISERHARSLLNVKNKEEQLLLLERIKKERLTVRQLEAEIKKKSDAMNNNYNNQVNMNNNQGNMSNNQQVGYNANINYNSMGLNDYTTQVNQGLFNNIPNNFNTSNPSDNQSGYGNFGIPSENNFESPNVGNNNQFMMSGYSDDNNDDNRGSGGFSLGAIFDNKNNNPDRENNRNIFVSRIKEDEVSSEDNRFIPNFDNIQPAPMNFDDTNSNDQFGMNNFNDMLSNNNYDNNNMMNTGDDYAMQNNMGMNVNYNPNQNQNLYNNPHAEVNNPYNQMNNNPYGQLSNNSYPNNQYNNNFSNQGYHDNNQQPQYNNFNSIPDLHQNPNQMQMGNPFEQQLRIVDVPKSVEFQSDMNEVENVPFDNPLDDKYENILYANPVPVQSEEQRIEDADIEVISHPDDHIEIISDNNEEPEIIDVISHKEENPEYIKLEEDKTLTNVYDAVLEIKKATDKIKYNGFNVESEEINFDDAYQITIKIKKSE